MTFSPQATIIAPSFAPTMHAAHARLAAVRPHAYARTRNALDGAVSCLSPYITHGMLSLPEVLGAVHALQPLEVQHKFVYELAWRTYFAHMWTHQKEGIFSSLHEGPLPAHAYAGSLPADIRQARTGIPVIDQAVRMLYASGWLHNHARMWLASYIVHLRRIDWRTGADWMWGHLLDGDLASNHLSWQWVAGTGSSKPYLFNADNVAKYAPPDWHSPSTAVDHSYEALDTIARGGKLPAQRMLANGVSEPALYSMPPVRSTALVTDGGTDPAGWQRPNAVLLDGRTVQVVHPWSLGAIPEDALHMNDLIIAICPSETTQNRPWSALRWQFVSERMRSITPHCWFASATELHAALGSAAKVHMTDNPHLPGLLRAMATSQPPALFTEPAKPCASFSKYWQSVTARTDSLDALLRP